MIKAFNNLGIRHKLLTVGGLFAVLIGVFIFTFFPYQQKKQMLEEHLTDSYNIAKMTADNLRAALEFDDKRNARNVLEILSEHKDFTFVLVLDAAGEEFAGINKNLAVAYADTDQVSPASFITKGTAVTIMPIISAGRRIGSIILGLSVERINDTLYENTLTALTVSIILITLLLVFSLCIGNMITSPIKKIIDVSSHIANGNFNRRVIVESRDEVGQLADAFNVMTERLHESIKQIEQSEETYRLNFEHISDVIYTLSPDMEVLSISPSIKNLLGYAPEELIGKRFDELNILLPEYRQPARSAAEQVHNDGSVETAEYEFLAQDGRCKPVEVSMAPLFREGVLVAYIASARDISQRKMAERRIYDMLENVKLLTVILDTKGNITFCNDYLLQLTGWLREEVLGCNWFSTFYPEDARSAALVYYAELKAKTGTALYKEQPLITRSGGTRIIFWNNTVLKDEQGKIIGTASIGEDITERKAAEADRMRMAAAFDQADEIIVITDAEGIIQHVNPAFENITGFTRNEVIGQKPSIVKSGEQDEEFYMDLWDTISSGNVWKGHFINKKKNGFLYDEDATISPIKDEGGAITNYVAVKRDSTQEIRLESQLRQAQKMEAIGTLAGGIAHDFNNILGAIFGFTELSLVEIEHETSCYENLQQVLLAANRARDLVKQILTFSRRTEHEKKPLQVSLIIKEALKFMRASLPSTIEIRQHIQSSSDIVQADPTQVHQILMNLCTNANHAMRERGGVLDVTLCDVDISSPEASGLHDVAPGPFLKLTVQDNGPGIERETLERIFEPYFTTKEQGEGTGLGLAVVHGIVKNLGGDITVETEIDKGTTFDVYLPKFCQTIAPEPPSAITTLAGTERILLIDDEPALVRAGQKMLERLGYAVLSTTDASEAFEAFKKAPYSFDVVIADKTMPGMTGFELASALKLIRPDIHIIICTGYSESDDRDKAQELGVDDFILKPIRTRILAESVRKVLT